MGDERRVVLLERGLQLVERRRVRRPRRRPRRTTGAAAPGGAAPRPAGPPPSAEPAARPAAGAARSGRAATCSSAGGRTGATRPTSARARSDHSKTRPGRRARRRARARGRPGHGRGRPACSAGRGCRTRTARRAGRPGRPARGRRAWRPSPRARASSARTSRQSSRVVDRVRQVDRAPGAAASARRRGRPAHGDPGTLQLAGRWRPARVPWACSSADQAVHPVEQRRGSVPPAGISATSAAASARSRSAGLAWPRNRRADRRATTRALAGSSRSSVQARVSSHSAWKVRSRREPYAGRGRVERPGGLARPAGRGQDLGAVLLDGGAVRPPRAGQHLARLVDHLERPDEVTAQQPGVAEVVLGLGPLHVAPVRANSSRARRSPPPPRHVAPLEVDVAAVEEDETGLPVVRRAAAQGPAETSDRSLGARRSASGAVPAVASLVLSRAQGPARAVRCTGPDPSRCVPGLGLGVRQGQVDARGQVGVIGVGTGLLEEATGLREPAVVGVRGIGTSSPLGFVILLPR